jgi:orotidine-5'-phosphate decarboxylase
VAGSGRPLTAGRPFGDILAASVAARESQIVLGLDPDPGALWPDSGPAHAAGSPAERAATAVVGHCRMLIEATAEACVAVKLQLACFERLGGRGWSALEAVAADAKAHGLLVIADGKRGDVPLSARAYAQALFAGVDTPFGRAGGLGADLATVNPLLGREAIEPFVATAREAGAGVLVVVRTSNPGAADVEDLALESGGPVWERVAAIVEELGRPGVGKEGISDVGAVMGATAPAHLARARELMGSATFLLPGVGAQGGRVEELAAAFAPGRAGGLVSASRSIAAAHERLAGGAAAAAPAAAARAEAERLREAAWTLSDRVWMGS